VRTGEWSEALVAYRELEELEPDSPIWPERRASVHANLKQPVEQIESLQRAADCYVDAGEIIKAIAACKQVLDIDPDHADTLDRLSLLYIPPSDSPACPSSGAPDDGESIGAASETELDAPLDEVLLTEAIPGVRPSSDADNSESGIHEIPIDNDSTGVLDLRLLEEASELGLAESISPQQHLARTPLFGSLDPATMARLIKQSRFVELREGEILFREGDPSKALYVIVEGAVIPISERDNERHLNVLEEGQFFGEIGILTNERRMATIKAMVDTRLLAIDRSVIRELVRAEPEVLKTLLRFFRERLIDMQIKTSPFFTAFTRAERSAVARQFRLLEVRRGTEVIRQDEQVKGLYVILSGEFDIVDSNSQIKVGALSSGDLIGGLPLVEREPALASVIATKKSWLLLMPESRFRKIAEYNPGLEELVAELARDWDGVTAISGANY
jgi:CRP-like cAMP-binding protein